MEIERTTFGTITIDGKTNEHDVIIRLSGEVARRKKKLSKKYYGTSHVHHAFKGFVWLRGHASAFVITSGLGDFRRPAARSRTAINSPRRDRKSTRLNSSHPSISYAVF